MNKINYSHKVLLDDYLKAGEEIADLVKNHKIGRVSQEVNFNRLYQRISL